MLCVEMSYDLPHNFVTCRAVNHFLSFSTSYALSYIFIAKYVFCSIYVHVCHVRFGSRMILSPISFPK
jgi:hypothetical protein